MRRLTEHLPIMKLSKVLCLPLILLLNACGDNPEPQPEPLDLVAVKSQIQEIIDARVGPGLLQGVSVSVLFPDGRQVNATGGISDENVPVTEDMRFGIASITKTAVAATILRLREEGRLELTDPLIKFVNLGNPNVTDSVTIFQLLNHFSGIKGYFQHENFWPTIESDLSRPLPPADLVAFIGEPLFSPRATFSYSNSNYLLLGLVIESVTGQTVGQAMRERFWDPLGLESIYFAAQEPPTGPVASPWRDMDDDGVLDNIASLYGPAYNSGFYTAADLFSTAEDLAKWAQELYTGSAISDESRELMLRFVGLSDPVFSGYGLGVREIVINGKVMIGHTGGMRGYGSIMLMDTEENIVITLLNNQSRTENGPLLRFEVFTGIMELVLSPVQ